MKIVRRRPQEFFGIEDEESRPTLESISIKNFKSLGDWNEIPIRPITLIFGKNSAGKSSVLHSILWLRDILPLGNINLRWLSKSADFVDLGYLHEFLYKSPNQKSDSIGFRIKLKDNKKIAKEFLKDQILNNLEKLIKENQEIDEKLFAESPNSELMQRAKHQLSQGENQL
jgi:AAA15 family ATPase/GTPase